jgi:hypothetical protein
MGIPIPDSEFDLTSFVHFVIKATGLIARLLFLLNRKKRTDGRKWVAWPNETMQNIPPNRRASLRRNNREKDIPCSRICGHWIKQ